MYYWREVKWQRMDWNQENSHAVFVICGIETKTATFLCFATRVSVNSLVTQLHHIWLNRTSITDEFSFLCTNQNTFHLRKLMNVPSFVSERMVDQCHPCSSNIPLKYFTSCILIHFLKTCQTHNASQKVPLPLMGRFSCVCLGSYLLTLYQPPLSENCFRFKSV